MIILVALLRIIPYALTGWLAYKKGYKRLTLAIAFLIIFALVSAIWPLTPEARSIFASIFALLLFWHAVDLIPKVRK